MKTAYPRFKKIYSEEELEQYFQPSKAELQFISKHAKKDALKLTLLTMLKSHQYLGYLPHIPNVPKSLQRYLTGSLGLRADLELVEPSDNNLSTFNRYRRVIRAYLGIFPWTSGFRRLCGLSKATASLVGM